VLAKRRVLRLNGDEVERTPLLVPSFSSKGFPEVAKTIEYMSELIDSAALVSAYDVHYKKIEAPFDFPSLLFVDSGGYEASKDADLSDFGEWEHSIQPWTQEMHEAVLAKWSSSVPIIFISYDHPKERLSFVEQVERARGMAPGRKGVLREILLKPETEGAHLLKIPTITGNISALAEFDVIGVTEKEVGNSIMSRMQNIARIRMALANQGLETPIHVFGSLDTVTTPMYFLAGADIFDGLTWLRFAFENGQTLYKHNYGATTLGITMPAHKVDGLCWNHNYYYIKELELQMRGFLKEQDFSAFKHHSELFRNALRNTMEAVGD
jgi:hypothetical protein